MAVTAKAKAKKEKAEEVENEEVENDADVDVEVADEEQEPVISSGITTELASDTFSFAPIDTELTPEERAPLVRDMLQKSQDAEGIIEIMQGELLYEAHKNEYWKEYTFVDDTGTERAFADWDEYVLTDLGLKRRTSYKRMELFDVFVNQLELDVDTLKGIKWSKAGLVTKLVTPENAEAMLEAIGAMSFRQTEQFAKQLKVSEDIDEAKATVLAPKAITDDSDVDIEGGDGTTSGDPGEATKTFSVKGAAAQLENIEAAISVAASITGSDSKINNLDVICSEYLATNASNAEGGEDAHLEAVARIIESVQTNFGIELSIASMPEDDDDAGA